MKPIVGIYWLMLFVISVNCFPVIQQLEFPEDVQIKIEDEDTLTNEGDGTEEESVEESESSDEQAAENSEGYPYEDPYYNDYSNGTLDYNQTYYEYQPDFNNTYDLTSGSGSGAAYYWPGDYADWPAQYEGSDSNPFQGFLGEDYYQEVPETLYESLHEL
nr:protein E30A [Elephant endotheliotropic herpesvirus 4A]